MPTNNHKSPVSVNLGATNKFQRVGKFTNMESVNNEDRLLSGFLCNPVHLILCIYKHNFVKGVIALERGLPPGLNIGVTRQKGSEGAVGGEKREEGGVLAALCRKIIAFF